MTDIDVGSVIGAGVSVDSSAVTSKRSNNIAPLYFKSMRSSAKMACLLVMLCFKVISPMKQVDKRIKHAY